MVLPNFIGIGASRSGSTWLDKQLRSHPDIFMPDKRKEVHFFNSFYDRGIGWYKQFFPNEDDLASYKAIGEFTPGYLSDPKVPERIVKYLPEVKLLVILRDPVERAYSQWKYRVQKRAEKRTFEKFIKENDEPVQLGLYGEHLERFLSFFSREQFLILIFERAVANPDATLKSVGNFLDIDPSGFNKDIVKKHFNASYVPKFQNAYHMAFLIKQYMRDKGFDRIVNTAKNFGIEKVFGKKNNLPKINQSTRESFARQFNSDRQKLKEILDDAIPEWKF